MSLENALYGGGSRLSGTLVFGATDTFDIELSKQFSIDYDIKENEALLTHTA